MAFYLNYVLSFGLMPDQSVGNRIGLKERELISIFVSFANGENSVFRGVGN